MVESVDNEISGVKRRMEEQLFYAAKKKREYSCNLLCSSLFEAEFVVTIIL